MRGPHPLGRNLPAPPPSTVQDLGAQRRPTSKPGIGVYAVSPGPGRSGTPAGSSSASTAPPLRERSRGPIPRPARPERAHRSPCGVGRSWALCGLTAGARPRRVRLPARGACPRTQRLATFSASPRRSGAVGEVLVIRDHGSCYDVCVILCRVYIALGVRLGAQGQGMALAAYGLVPHRLHQMQPTCMRIHACWLVAGMWPCARNTLSPRKYVQSFPAWHYRWYSSSSCCTQNGQNKKTLPRLASSQPSTPRNVCACHSSAFTHRCP